MKNEVIFESERINFIKVTKDLLYDYMLMVNNDEVQKFISHKKKHFNEEQELEWIKEKLDNNHFIFSMIEKDTNEYIGNIELIHIIDNSGEIGICITPNKQSKHYGREAIEAFINHARKELKLDNIELYVYDFNPRAIKCYKEAGFEEDNSIRNGNEIHMVYKR